MNSKVDPTTATLVQMLDATAKRHRVLSNNLANVDTPGYIRKDMSFENELAEAVSAGHPESAQFTVTEDTSDLPRADGNNVNVEKELSEMNKNSMTHQMALQLLQSKMAMERIAVTGKS